MSAPDPSPTPTSRSTRSRAYAFGLLALGGVGGLIAAGRPWWSGAAEGSSVSFSGTESTAGLAQAAPLVVLAGTLLALVLRSRGRRVLGVLLALVAAGGVVTGALRPQPPRELVLSRLQTITLGEAYDLRSTAWSLVFAGAGLVAVAGALILVTRAARWPERAARFERNASEGLAGGVGPGGPDVPVDGVDGATLWSALDAGVDPTDTDSGPIRRTIADGVRMRSTPDTDAATDPDRGRSTEGESAHD